MKLKGQLEQAQLENTSSDPSNLPDGLVWLNTSTNKAKVYAGAATREILTNDQTQTVTNKTIDATANTISNIRNAEVKTDAAIAYSKLAALTASRVVVSDGSGVVSASSVTTTTLGYLDASSSIQTQLNAKAPSASPTLTTPTIDIITLDGQGSTPASPSAGCYKAYVKYSTNKLTILDSSGNETTVGSGGGGINLITNGDAESGTTGWATYADAAGTRPVDGTGGSPSVTWTTSSSSPLYGVNSFLFTKDAANRQGQGASYAFTVQPAHQAKVLNISFDYIVSSGTFVAGTSSTDSDVIAYIYDVTNSQLIEPSSIKLLSNSTSIADRFNASFQTSATGTSYRLILHCASTSASAYVVKFDNIQVSPSNYSYGTPITDWQSYSPTVVGFGTTSNSDCYWRRVGSNIEVNIKFTTGTCTAVEAQVPLPSGFTSVNFPQGIRQAGNFTITATTTTAKLIPLIEASKSYIVFGNQDGASGFTKINGTTGFGNTAAISFIASVPCAGLSSSVQMSDQQDTRVVDFHGTKGSTQAVTSAVTDITFTTSKDSHGAWSGSQYTVPVAGDYFCSLAFADNATGTYSVYPYVNGTITTSIITTSASGTRGSGSVLVPNLKVGDVLSFRTNSTSTLAALGSLSILRMAGPNQIAASETIAASYYMSASGTYSTTAPINMDTKEFDTHNAVTTGASWKFTAPAAGLYSVGGSIDITAGASVTIYKNGTAYKRVGYDVNATDASYYGTIRLIAGDYIDIRPNGSVTVSGSATLAASPTNINIIRVGL